MKGMGVIFAGVALVLSACGNPASKSDQERNGAYRHFTPAKHVAPTSRPLPSNAAPSRNGILNLIV